MIQLKKYIPLILGIASGTASAVGLIYLVGRRRAERDSLSIWLSVLTQCYGTEKAQQLIAAVRNRIAELTASATLPQNRALRRHLTESILPGLALYQALLNEHGSDQAAALAEVEQAFRAQTLEKNRGKLSLLRLTPAPFLVFRLVFAQTMKQFPAEGWEITDVENSPDRVAFNMTRCFYMNTLTAYGAPELTASFCKSDEVMADLFPPSLRFVRPHTLGCGDVLCDFQYCRVKQP